MTEFYREEFLKHHKCLQAQREYYSAQAIQNVETALLKIIADLDRLSEDANAAREAPRRTPMRQTRRRPESSRARRTAMAMFERQVANRAGSRSEPGESPMPW